MPVAPVMFVPTLRDRALPYPISIYPRWGNTYFVYILRATPTGLNNISIGQRPMFVTITHPHYVIGSCPILSVYIPVGETIISFTFCGQPQRG